MFDKIDNGGWAYLIAGAVLGGLVLATTGDVFSAIGFALFGPFALGVAAYVFFVAAVFVGSVVFGAMGDKDPSNMKVVIGVLVTIGITLFLFNWLGSFHETHCLNNPLDPDC